ncbi:hypothetical protein TanjilG_08670 [Lupinus angustifolius]|uniref:MADS-box domain-containing protein n=1 Tax=Lupinus angustifolius TaxID=3871 RepID=A0A4P1QWX8_LUPAN|nr:PREDICTED: agamous-like MADS-box protein AGL29 [Lupinus angustifolius]OIV96809.1 hypothetical protein TanjilG_08670 [Lupinus angustifolius]
MGRRKIEIKMVKDLNTRQVTFSKRRSGLFKKANELSIMCGCELAIVMFSHGNKPYSYGHPNVDSVAAKILHQELNSSAVQCDSSSNDETLNKLSQELDDILDQTYEEEKKGEELDKLIEQKKKELEKVEDLSVYEEMRRSIKERINEMEAVEAMLMIKEQEPIV